MKKLSFWAKKNPRPARWLIAGGRVLLALHGLFLGLVLASLGQHWATGLAWGSAGAWAIACIGYPVGRPGRSQLANYGRRKTCDALLVAASWLCYVGLGNVASPMTSAPVTSAQQESRAAYATLKWNSTWKSSETRARMLNKCTKVHRHAVKELRAARQKLGEGTIALLILLSLIIAAGLGYLVAAAACNLSCGGQEGAAVLVALLGAAAIAFIIFAMWRFAIRSARRKQAGAKPTG